MFLVGSFKLPSRQMDALPSAVQIRIPICQHGQLMLQEVAQHPGNGVMAPVP